MTIQSTKGHCKHSNWGKCMLSERLDEKCIGYENCEDFQIDTALTAIKDIVVPSESEITKLLFPFVENIHNITHSYMKKKISPVDCGIRQNDEITKLAKAIHDLLISRVEGER